MGDSSEWTPFAVGNPSTGSNAINPACAPLENVYHIAHVADALRIFEDRVIRSSLVWDESRLRTKRTCVSWVSPNDWWQGSIYGTVRFSFDWQRLIRRKRLYWVEEHKTRRQQIVRLLLSKEEFTDEPLCRYDPMKRDGPLYRDGKSKDWFWNSHGVTHEYLVVDDLPAKLWKTVRFVRHHPEWCSKGGADCEGLSRSSMWSARRVLARLLARDRREFAYLFARDSASDKLDVHIEFSLKSLRQRITSWCKRHSSMRFPPAQRRATIRAVLLLYSCGDFRQAKALANIFPSEVCLRKAFNARVKKYFECMRVDRNSSAVCNVGFG